MGKNNKKGKIDFKYNLKLYLSFLNRYRPIVILLLLISLIVESLNILDKFLFRVLIDRGTQFSSHILNIDNFARILLFLGAVYVVASVGRAILKFVSLHYVNKLEANLITDLKRKFFDHIIHLDYEFHTRHKTGSLISKLTRIGNAVERLTDVIFFNIFPLLFQLTVISASLIYFSWIPALILFLTVIVFILYSFVVQQIQEYANIEANNAEDLEKANISDMFMNIESIKYFGKENIIKSRFRSISESTKEKTFRFWNYFRWLDSVQFLILSIGTFFLVYFTLTDFLNGKYSLGTLVFVYTVFATLVTYLFGFVYGIRNFYRSMADFEVLFQYAKVKNKIKDTSTSKEFKVNEGEIKFNNITFKYGKRTVFKNFSLLIPKNKKIALVGHSGCGKTTLIKLLYRLYDVDSGMITIDKENIRNFKQESLRSGMSIVPQECMLFDDTVYNNIAFSKPGTSKGEVMNAIKSAQLDRIIKTFPNKEKTIVGERGIKLSGGEKQRVSIARAVLANKKVLVLDEATSSLDSHTEHDIKQALEELMKNKTSIIIAHRLSTIMGADKIIVMSKGKIVQEGTHQELIKQEGEYKHLWSLQKGGYIK